MGWFDLFLTFLIVFAAFGLTTVVVLSSDLMKVNTTLELGQTVGKKTKNVSSNKLD